MIVGFIIVPFAAALLTFVAFLALFAIGAGPPGGGRVTEPLKAAISLGIGAWIIAVIVITFGAVPGVAWLGGRGLLSLRNVLVLGAALGNAPFVIISIGIVLAEGIAGTLSAGAAGAARGILVGSFVGVGSAAIFWLVALAGSAR